MPTSDSVLNNRCNQIRKEIAAVIDDPTQHTLKHIMFMCVELHTEIDRMEPSDAREELFEDLKVLFELEAKDCKPDPTRNPPQPPTQRQYPKSWYSKIRR